MPGLLIFDLRETLVTNGYRDKVTNQVYTLYQLGNAAFENRYESVPYLIVGGKKTVNLINRLQQNGFKIAIATGDKEDLREEIIAKLSEQAIKPDLIYNFHSLAADIGTEFGNIYSSDEVILNFRKPDFYTRIVKRLYGPEVANHSLEIYIFDDGFSSDEPDEKTRMTMKQYALSIGYRENQLIAVDSRLPYTLTDRLQAVDLSVFKENTFFFYSISNPELFFNPFYILYRRFVNKEFLGGNRKEQLLEYGRIIATIQKRKDHVTILSILKNLENQFCQPIAYLHDDSCYFSYRDALLTKYSEEKLIKCFSQFNQWLNDNDQAGHLAKREMQVREEVKQAVDLLQIPIVSTQESSFLKFFRSL